MQAFAQWSNNNLFHMINAGMDQFGINYGIAAIGPEIVANRLGVGPMGNAQQPKRESPNDPAPHANQKNDAVDLKYEEFFLSSWSVGDPAMIVDVPANAPNQAVTNPEQGSAIVPEKVMIKGKVGNDPVQYINFKDLSGLDPNAPGRPRLSIPMTRRTSTIATCAIIRRCGSYTPGQGRLMCTICTRISGSNRPTVPKPLTSTAN